MRDVSAVQRGKDLVERTIDKIGQDIVSGRLSSEAQLPNETEWCEKLEISRSVLREALRVLVSKKLITIRARTGGRIRPRSDWSVLDPDILRWLCNGEDQRNFSRELFEVRRIVEPAAARIAAERAKPEQIAELRRCCDEMAAAGEDSDLFIEPDNRYHRTLLEAVGNSLVRGLTETITVALEVTLRMSLNARRGNQPSVPLHRAVCEAVASRNGDAAYAAMLLLVDESAMDVAELLNLPDGEKRLKSRLYAGE